MSFSITLQYFAQLREQRGTDAETIQLSEPTTAGQLYQQLQQQHGFSLAPEVVRPAINGRYRDWNIQLSDGDVAVFIPPVAGG